MVGAKPALGTKSAAVHLTRLTRHMHLAAHAYFKIVSQLSQRRRDQASSERKPCCSVEKADASRLEICCCWVVPVVPEPVVVEPVVLLVVVPLASALTWESRLLVEPKLDEIRSLIELSEELVPMTWLRISLELDVDDVVAPRPSRVDRLEADEAVVLPSIMLISALSWEAALVVVVAVVALVPVVPVVSVVAGVVDVPALSRLK